MEIGNNSNMQIINSTIANSGASSSDQTVKSNTTDIQSIVSKISSIITESENVKGTIDAIESVVTGIYSSTDRLKTISEIKKVFEDNIKNCGGMRQRSFNDIDGSEQDLYQTDSWVIITLVRYLFNILGNSKKLIILDPCSGPHKIIECIFKEHLSHLLSNFISTDKFYYGNIDFFLDPIESYDNVDLVVTNPPWNHKIEMVSKLYNDGKSFALLLPLVSLGISSLEELFQAYGVHVLILIPAPKFLHEGKDVFTGPVAWYLYIKGMSPEIKVSYLYKEE
jgi:hypothetical protein